MTEPNGALPGAAIGSALGGGAGGTMIVQLGSLLETVRQIQTQHPELQTAFTGAMSTLQQIHDATGGRVPELKEAAGQAVEQQTQSAQVVSEKVGQTADDYKSAHDKVQNEDDEQGGKLKRIADGVHLGAGPAPGTQAYVDEANQKVDQAQGEYDTAVKKANGGGL